MVCTDIASGTRVQLAYTEEAICGVTPSAVGTLVAAVTVDKTGAAADQLNFTRVTGSWLDDGLLPDQYVNTVSFATGANNAVWRVISATALTLIVSDPLNVGVDEVSGPGVLNITLSTLRATSREINNERDTLESEEVRQDRQKSDVRHGFNQVTGSPGYELSVESYDDFMRFAMSGDYVTPVSGATGNVGITGATPGAGTATIDRASGSWITQGFRPGEMITTTGFADGANNQLWRITAVTALTLEIYDPDDTVVTEAASGGPAIAYVGERIDIGVSLRTATVEQRFNDIEQYIAFRGVAVNEWSMSVSPESIVNGTWTLLGMSGTDLGPTPLTVEDPRLASTTTPLAAFDGLMFEGGENIALATSYDFSLANNRTLEGVVGSKFSPGVFEGQAVITGNITFFLRDQAIYTKFYNEIDSSIYLRMSAPDDANEFINVIMPKVKYLTGTMDPPPEGPVPLSMDYQALVAEVAAPGGLTTTTSLTIQKSNLRI
jgi:hypothetical protein